MPGEGISSTRRKVLSAIGAGAGVITTSGVGSADISTNQEIKPQEKSKFKNILKEKYPKSEAEEIYNIVINYVESTDVENLVSNPSFHRQRINDEVIKASNTDTITNEIKSMNETGDELSGEDLPDGFPSTSSDANTIQIDDCPSLKFIDINWSLLIAENEYGSSRIKRERDPTQHYCLIQAFFYGGGEVIQSQEDNNTYEIPEGQYRFSINVNREFLIGPNGNFTAYFAYRDVNNAAAELEPVETQKFSRDGPATYNADVYIPGGRYAIGWWTQCQLEVVGFPDAGESFDMFRNTRGFFTESSYSIRNITCSN